MLTTVRHGDCIDSRVEACCARLVAKTGDDEEFEVVTVDDKLMVLLNETDFIVRQRAFFTPVTAPPLPHALSYFRPYR